jgi:hypothetical protein
MKLRHMIRVWLDVIRPSGIGSTVLVLLLISAPARAVEIEPRAYSNAPVGVNFLILGYGYSEGGLSTEASSPIKDAHLQIHTGIFAYARTMNAWGKPAKIDLVIPYSTFSGSAKVAGQTKERNVSGFHDPRFRMSMILYGAPNLTVEEFSQYRQNLIIGASIQVSPPLGQYDSDKMVNLGNNRWFVKPEVGTSKTWGAFTLELSTGIAFFSVNDNYFGGKRLEQEPLSTTQLHAIYNFDKGVWAAVSGTYEYGGRTSIDGVRKDDLLRNSRIGFTLVLPVNRNNSIKLYGSTDISISAGSDYGLGGIVWQYRWGGGL